MKNKIINFTLILPIALALFYFSLGIEKAFASTNSYQYFSIDQSLRRATSTFDYATGTTYWAYFPTTTPPTALCFNSNFPFTGLNTPNIPLTSQGSSYYTFVPVNGFANSDLYVTTGGACQSNSQPWNTNLNIYSVPPGLSFNIINPVDATTTQSAFANWKIHVENNGTSSVTGIVTVHYNTSSSWANGNIFDSYQPFGIKTTFATGTTDIYIPVSLNLFGNTDYVAQVVFYGGSFDITSPIITFHTVSETIPTVSVVPLTNNPFVSASTTDTLWNGILDFLFTPPASVYNYMQDYVNGIKAVFPFNIVYGVVSSVQNNTSSTPVDYNDLTLTVPATAYTGAISLNPLSDTFLQDRFTTPTCDTTCAGAKKDTVFHFMSAIIWVGLAFKLITLIA